MRPRLLSVVATGVLTISLLPATLGSAVAAGPDREGPGPVLPEQASAVAQERASVALERAQALFAEKSPAAVRQLIAEGGAEATLVLNELMRVRDDLSPAERAEADRLLARPTAAGGDGSVDYTVREARPVCGGAICVHYVRRTADAPPKLDSDGDGVPNAVEQTLRVTRDVHNAFVGSGYRRPDPDGTLGGRVDKVDIYLADLGDSALYGYCTSDQFQAPRNTFNRWAYCAVDEDFARAQFPTNTPTQNRQVTLAHEYYHAVQYAYDAFEDPWLMEATAAWVEDELYDRVDDNRQYLRAGQLGRPWISLDKFGVQGNHYGNWLFFRYLTERWPAQTGSLPTLVLDVWDKLSGRAEAPDLYSTKALEATLAERSVPFAAAYGDFTEANRDPAEAYQEGAAYGVSEPLARHELRQSEQGAVGTASLDHLASETVRIVPGSGLSTAPRTVRLEVNMSGSLTVPFVRVLVHRSDGTTTRSAISLTSDGGGSTTVPFTRGQVTNVELVLGNASRRMIECWADTAFACAGRPRDDNEDTSYRVALVN